MAVEGRGKGELYFTVWPLQTPKTIHTLYLILQVRQIYKLLSIQTSVTANTFIGTQSVKSYYSLNTKAKLEAAAKLPQLSAELAKAPDAAAAKFLSGYSRTDGMTSPDNILRTEMFILILQCVIIFSLCCCNSYAKYNHY